MNKQWSFLFLLLLLISGKIIGENYNVNFFQKNTSSNVKQNDSIVKLRLLKQLNEIVKRDSIKKSQSTKAVEFIQAKPLTYAVTLFEDTLFYLIHKIGSYRPEMRAKAITERIRKLYDDDFFIPDSLVSVPIDEEYDLLYGETIIMSVTKQDAAEVQTTTEALSHKYVIEIKSAIKKHRENRHFSKFLYRFSLVALILVAMGFLLWLNNRLFRKLEHFFINRNGIYSNNLRYKNYKVFSNEQFLKIILLSVKVVYWLSVLLLIYFVLPLGFRIFPQTQGWAHKLVELAWLPFKSLVLAAWNYLPNLFAILVIYIVIRNIVRLLHYVFSEIEYGKLVIKGFYSDWAMPTFNIVRFLVYAFMFVLIFPYLPGSDSTIFKGVSVFLGVLFSMGSSSAIANMVAGLVITYMRPFKLGDRIRIGEISGDVIEKSMLVTRLRTVKNEEITIPNSAILSGNTTNFSVYTKEEGLILHSTVTIGYDTPWKDMHNALIEAATKTEDILTEPNPFVLQTSLDDFYVSYQINAYTRNAKAMTSILSKLHQNIQDVCNERGIEIMSPHYRSERDGNPSTIPAGYKKSGFPSQNTSNE